MSDMRSAHEAAKLPDDDDGLKRSITGRLLFAYVLGDVLGAGIYVAVGAVAAAVGGAFWLSFLIGVLIATITGTAYAELVTKYPQAAGAALYVNRAFRNKPLTFLVTFSMLSASFAAAASLATGFTTYFNQLLELPVFPVAVGFLILLAVINFIGITESVILNLIMTIVEVVGLVIVVLVAIITIAQGDADLANIGDFSGAGDGSVLLAILAGVGVAFFAMTGFENAANVAEETVDPAKSFPRALIGGMLTAGVIYVLVSMAAAVVLDPDTLAQIADDGDPALIDVVTSGALPIAASVLVVVFSLIAMTAITNTTLVASVTQARILYGMAREDIVPRVFGRLHPTRRSPWVGLIFSVLVVSGLLLTGAILETLLAVTVIFTLVIYGLVIVSALKLRGTDEGPDTFTAPTWLLVIGIVGNLGILVYVVVEDPSTLLYCAGLLAVGGVLFALEYFFGSRDASDSPDPEHL